MIERICFPGTKGKDWYWLAIWLGALPLVTLGFVLALRPPELTIAANTVVWSEVTEPATSGMFVSLVFGDITNDGHLDLLGGLEGGGVWAITGDGAGNWTPLSPLTDSGTYYGLAVGDVNSDGKLDVIAAEEGSGIHIWIGDGAGGWTTLTSPIDTGKYRSVALGDINHDGKLDIAAGSGEDSGLEVWTGDGAGGWSPASTGLPDTGTYTSLAIDDVDRDGKLDLVATSQGDGLQAWKGNGGSAWTEHSIGPPPSGIYKAVALGDLDNDGDLDIAVSGDGSGVAAWTGSGGHSWSWADASAGLPGSGDYWGIAMGDVNSDGKLDIAASSPSGGVWVWIGDGGGIWSEASTGLPASGAYYPVALGDLDDDGMLDLAAGMSAGGGARAWIDTGIPDVLGGWRQIMSPTTSGLHQGLDVGDFNGDGKLDVVATTNDNGVQLWTGDGGNTWSDIAAWTDPDLPTSGNYQGVAFGDIDHDGFLDVVVGRGTSNGIEAWRFLNNGWHEFSSGLPNTGIYTSVALSDLNNDGHLDIVAGGEARGVRAWTGDGTGVWTPAVTGLPTTVTFYSVAVGDVNHDGYQDIVAGSNGDGIGVWQGNGGTSWTLMPRPVTSGSWSGLALNDVNDDGQLDIVATEDGTGVGVWAGDGTFAWTALSRPTSSGKFASISLADFNNDGKVDVAAGSSEEGGLVVWAGDGGTSWSTYSTNLPNTGNYLAVAFGEIDNDGSLDLMGARYGDGSIHAWTGNEGAPPSGWANFAPADWITIRAPLTLTIQVRDTGSGLNPNSAEYSLWQGTSWSAWKAANCSGTAGVTTTQTISVVNVIFSQDSGPYPYLGNQVRFRVSDVVGNIGYSDDYMVKIDTTPPDNPTTFPDSSHHPGGPWRNDDVITVQDWYGDGDETSGVSAFSYVFSTTYQLPDTTPETGAMYRAATSQELPDGEWYLYMRTGDVAGNWAPDAAYDGPYRIDIGPPTNPTGFSASHDFRVWSNDNTIDINWWGATDGSSGVRGYAIAWTTTSSFSPEEIPRITDTYTTSQPLADNNNWYFHIKTVDYADNWTADPEDWGPFYIDATPPHSHVSSPDYSNSPSFTVSWWGTDNLSGVTDYDVQYRDVFMGTDWAPWLTNTPLTSATFDGEQSHTYEFRSQARDRAGNVEPVHADPDTTTVVNPFEFEAYGLEVTQAVQDLNNSVVLVSDKRTFVRFHVRSLALGDQGPVTAQLSAWREGISLGTILPNNPGGAITVRETPNRGELDHSFYFDLPSDWLHGTVQLLAEVNADRSLIEADYANNVQFVNVTFHATPELSVLLVDACYDSGGVTYHVDSVHYYALASWLRRAYPISSLDASTRRFNPCMDERPTARQVNRILRRNMRHNDDDDDPNLRYYGLIDVGGGFERGRARRYHHVASGPAGWWDRWRWDTDGSYADWYGGHELGHTYKRRHAEFCDAEYGDPYPYSMGDISPTRDGNAPNALYGFDVQPFGGSTPQVYVPYWKDVMTYCDYQWVSDFTYEGIRNEMLDEASRAAIHSRTAIPQEFLEVYGTIYTATDQVELDTFYRLTADWIYQPTPGEYSIGLFNAAGSVLADYSFQPIIEHLDPGPNGQAVTVQDEAAAADIDEYVPWVPGTTRIAIYHGAQELASRFVSSHSPQVAFLTSVAGDVLDDEQITVAWQASDADGDTLFYWLEYSTDGGIHWQLLGGELTVTNVVIDALYLPGTSKGKFRIVVSDGVNTSYDESQGTFTVPNKAPEVTIIAPSAGMSYISGQSIALVAVALDLEDGTLSDTALAWHSSLDGFLGTGQLLHVTDLVTGTHLITVTVTDGDGDTDEDEIIISVGESLNEIYLPLIMKDIR